MSRSLLTALIVPGTLLVASGLAGRDGEFCALDRAMIFEDPGGTRIHYDAGRTIRGPDDPRLGTINAVLLTHLHGDRLGDEMQPSANARGGRFINARR